jgi:hypothetical protein
VAFRVGRLACGLVISRRGGPRDLRLPPPARVPSVQEESSGRIAVFLRLSRCPGVVRSGRLDWKWWQKPWPAVLLTSSRFGRGASGLRNVLHIHFEETKLDACQDAPALFPNPFRAIRFFLYAYYVNYIAGLCRTRAVCSKCSTLATLVLNALGQSTRCKSARDCPRRV